MDVNVFNVFPQWFSPATPLVLGLSLVALLLLLWGLLSALPRRFWWALLLLCPLLAFWPMLLRSS